MRTVLKFIPYLVAGVLLIMLLQQCEDATRAEVALQTTTEEAKIWRDKFGRSNAEISVLKLDQRSFRQYHARTVDSLKKAGIKLKTVERIVTVNTTTSGSVVLKNNMYSDPWTKFSFRSDTLHFNLRDSLSLVTYHKKFGFLNLRSKYTTRAITHNPFTTLTGITSSDIIPKTRRLSFGLNVGYGFNLSDGVVRTGWHAGVGFQFRIL